MLAGRNLAVLDACVLLPPSLCDLLLRLAEAPALYRPRWSIETLDEVRRNQIGKFKFSQSLAESWRLEVSRSFPEATIDDYSGFLKECHNDQKDRHVLAAAIRCRADVIVTSNLRHFPSAALEPHGLTAESPARFLAGLWKQKPEVVLSKLDDIARDRNRARKETLKVLRKTVPGFVEVVARAEELELD